jgi:tRNA (mo5U34)-methyltransferase
VCPGVNPGELQERVDAIRWHHAIDLGGGIRTPGLSEATLSADQLPDLAGRSVLDIGAWDGYYSFLAEAQGATRVVALDHYVWGVDMAARNLYWGECNARSILPDHDRDVTDFWRPDLPGRAGFDLAREALGSRVEAVVGDIAVMDLAPLGQFDVVLFLGVLYHLAEPLAALRRVRSLTAGVAVVETEALYLGGSSEDSLLEFWAGGMGAGHDYGNWYVPTGEALRQLCLAAGFSRVETIVGPPAPAPAPPVPATPAAPPISPPAPPGRRWWPRTAGAATAPAAAPPAPPAPPPPPARSHYRAVVYAYA